MFDLVYIEFLKLKRSNMFLVSLLGAAGVPFMSFIGYLVKHRNLKVPIYFEDIFTETNMYIVLLIGTLLYGVITSYIFNREYSENTLKNILSIPISKFSILMAKLCMLFLWILLLTIISWSVILILGIIAHFQGLNIDVLVKSFKQFFLGGSLLFMVASPAVFIALKFKSYLHSIVFASVITMINILVSNSKYMALYPWSAVLVISNNMTGMEYSIVYSYTSIFTISILGFVPAIIYFLKEEI